MRVLRVRPSDTVVQITSVVTLEGRLIGSLYIRFAGISAGTSQSSTTYF